MAEIAANINELKPLVKEIKSLLVKEAKTPMKSLVVIAMLMVELDTLFDLQEAAPPPMQLVVGIYNEIKG